MLGGALQEYFLHDVLECTGYLIGKGSKWAKKGSAAKLRAPQAGGGSNQNLKFEGDEEEEDATGTLHVPLLLQAFLVRACGAAQSPMRIYRARGFTSQKMPRGVRASIFTSCILS